MGLLLVALAQGCGSADKERAPQGARSVGKEPESEGARILREFHSGQRRLPAGDGSSYFVGNIPGPCGELPAVRPPGFQINYQLLDGERPERGAQAMRGSSRHALPDGIGDPAETRRT